MDIFQIQILKSELYNWTGERMDGWLDGWTDGLKGRQVGR